MLLHAAGREASQLSSVRVGKWELLLHAQGLRHLDCSSYDSFCWNLFLCANENSNQPVDERHLRHLDCLLSCRCSSRRRCSVSGRRASWLPGSVQCLQSAQASPSLAHLVVPLVWRSVPLSRCCRSCSRPDAETNHSSKCFGLSVRPNGKQLTVIVQCLHKSVQKMPVWTLVACGRTDGLSWLARLAVSSSTSPYAVGYVFLACCWRCSTCLLLALFFLFFHLSTCCAW